MGAIQGIEINLTINATVLMIESLMKNGGSGEYRLMVSQGNWASPSLNSISIFLRSSRSF
jgi:hypothetical protein